MGLGITTKPHFYFTGDKRYPEICDLGLKIIVYYFTSRMKENFRTKNSKISKPDKPNVRVAP